MVKAMHPEGYPELGKGWVQIVHTLFMETSGNYRGILGSSKGRRQASLDATLIITTSMC
jgi:hypothetical protein